MNLKESEIQKSFIKMARLYLRDTGIIIYSNQNESYGSKRGNVFIAWPRLGFYGLYIEFKRDTTNKTYLKPDQREIIEMLRAKGYCVAVCRSADDAMELMKRYGLGSEPEDVMREHNWK